MKTQTVEHSTRRSGRNATRKEELKAIKMIAYAMRDRLAIATETIRDGKVIKARRGDVGHLVDIHESCQPVIKFNRTGAVVVVRINENAKFDGPAFPHSQAKKRMTKGRTVTAKRDIVEHDFKGDGKLYVHARKGDRGVILGRAHAGRGWHIIQWARSVYDSPAEHVQAH